MLGVCGRFGAGASSAGSATGDVFAVPAIGAEAFLGKPDGGNEIVQTLEGERREPEVPADVLHHLLVWFAVRIEILLDVVVRPLTVADEPARDEGVFGLRSREVEEPARIEERRTRNAHVRLLCAVREQALRLLA